LVVDQDGNCTYGTELYLDYPLPGLGNRTLRDLLPAGTISSIHSDYLDAYSSDDTRKEWYSWLHTSLGVNTAPRVLNGCLSPEFRVILSTVDPIDILILLSEFWAQIADKLSDASRQELSEIEIVCKNGERRALKDTYLKTKDLRLYSIPGICFLPFKNPDEDCWRFLKDLGVTIEVNALFYLKQLDQLRKADSRDEDAIQGIYTQLNARFQDDPSAIL